MADSFLLGLVADMVLASALGSVLGGMLYGMARDVWAWVERRPCRPPTADQMRAVAVALRRRAAQLEIRAEKRARVS